MLKYLLTIGIFIASFIFGLGGGLGSHTAHAQDIPANGGWCFARSFRDPVQCAGDPNSGCALAVREFYPDRTEVHTHTVINDAGTLASCQIDIEIARATGLFIGTPGVDFRCPAGMSRIGRNCARRTPKQPQTDKICPIGAESAPTAGNPIDVHSGIKFQTVTDFSTADGLLKLERQYSSRPYGNLRPQADSNGLGLGWSLAQMPRMFVISDDTASFHIPDLLEIPVRCRANENVCSDFTSDGRVTANPGRILHIDLEASNFNGDFSIPNEDIAVDTNFGVRYIFRTQEHRGRVYGHVKRVEYPAGYSIDYEASLQTNEIFRNGDFIQLTSPQFVITSMADTYERRISFEYSENSFPPAIFFGGVSAARQDQVGNITRIDLPDETYLTYSYESVTTFGTTNNMDERLEKMERFDVDNSLLDTETYLYENEDFPFALTGIIDDTGVVYSNWTYDEDGLATSSELNGGVSKYILEYIDDGGGFVQDRTIVTNPLGLQTQYDANGSGQYIDVITRFETSSTPQDFKSEFLNFATDDIRNTDFNGNVKNRIRNDEGWPERVTRSIVGREQTVTEIEWHPIYPVPSKVIELGLTTDYELDNQGRVLAMTQTDTSGNQNAPRTYGFTYQGVNVTSIDGPLNGPGDTQFFTYDGEKLTSFTDELGFVTQITDHNEIGAPAAFTDPNGNITRLNFDGKHRLTSIIESVGNLNATTRLTYSDVDLLTSVTQPNGSALFFEYDGARRLTAVENSVDERIDYTRNNMGGVSRSAISGPNGDGQIEFEITQVHDALNRVIETTTVGGTPGLTSVTDLSYDGEDNLTEIIDPRQNRWEQQYDGLHRLVKEIDPDGAQTDYGLEGHYDARNPLSSVTDARSVVTNYVRNGFGEVIREVTFEAGTTNYTRDTRGLITQMVDARGVITNYAYDDAGRVISETYPSDSSADIFYTYDEGDNGVGEMTSAVEGFGETAYSYNSLGFMTSKTRSINGQDYISTYTYDLAGEVLTETYPSGRTIRMQRDAAARIIDIQARGPGESEFTTLLSGVTYAPFGPLTRAEFGDGHVLDLVYDTAYRAKSLRRTSLESSLMDIDFEHDASGNILAMNDNVRPERSQRFTYDPISRLTSAENSAEGGYGVFAYEYNLVGDRLARNHTSNDGEVHNEAYSYDSTTARLTEVSVAELTARLFGYTDSGQLISDTRSDDVLTSSFTYGVDAGGRLATVSENDALKASYTYDMYEQRIIKAVTGETAIHYHYDAEGRLISETDGATGESIRDYVWLGLTPIASFGPANDNTSTSPETLEACDEGEIAALNAQASQIEAARIAWQNYASFLENLREVRTTQIVQIEAELETATGFQRFLLTWFTALLERSIAAIDNAAEISQTQITQLQGQSDTVAALIAAREEACEAAQADPDATAGLTFLHSDHLGRPQFGTNISGETVWDGGIATPFGVRLAGLGAQAQALMFPGQYEDAETTGAGVVLSHNWHRTYDPTLGRYLQADPIGLAGGLNRYAYVGSNPMGYVDPTGEILFAPILIGIAAGAAIDVAFQLAGNGGQLNCIDFKSVAISGALGAFGAGGGLARSGFKRAGQEWSHFIAKRNVNKLTSQGSKLNKALNRPGGLNGQWVSPQRHSGHDYYRRLRGEIVADKPKKLWRGFDRIPDYLKGGVLVPGLGGTRHLVSGDDCGC